MPPSLRQACHAASAIRTSVPPRLPELSGTAKALRKLKDLPEIALSSNAVDWNAVAVDVASVLASGDPLSRRQLRDAPWCLWPTRPAIAEDPVLLDRLLTTITSATSARPFRTLASAFVANFGAGQSGQAKVSACLARIASRWGGIWGRLQESYAIFDPVDGPRNLALEVNARDRSPVDILREAGVGQMSAQGGYTKAIVAALLVEFAAGAERAPLDRLAKVRRYAMSEAGHPLFGDQRAAILDALLRPFVGRPPTEPIQDEYLALILASFGDPRLRPGQWVGMPHRDIVVGWLTRQSLRQFLDIVDQTAVERMWRYRRAFWEGVYDFFRKHDVPVEAWVAFGPRGARLAQKTFGKQASFATLHTTSKTVEDGHAVLLFKVGECMIADWSHRGRVNIWTRADARDAPALYRPNYGSSAVQIHAAGNLDTPDLYCISHVVPENYNWQDRVAARLHSLTGLRIPRSVYKV